jgi:hypothetical protein
MDEGSVTCWIRRLRAGEQTHCQELWQRYFRRLVGLARDRLRATPRQAADEEDVALNTLDSVFRGLGEGRFPRLLDRDDLWGLLGVITLRKAANLARHERARRQGGGKVQHASALPAGAEEEGALFAELMTWEPATATTPPAPPHWPPPARATTPPSSPTRRGPACEPRLWAG